MPMIEFERIDMVGIWSLKVPKDTCDLCKEDIMSICATCKTGSFMNDCSVSSGKCGHVFHSHCIQSRLKTNKLCPTDNTEWKYDKNPLDKQNVTANVQRHPSRCKCDNCNRKIASKYEPAMHNKDDKNTELLSIKLPKVPDSPQLIPSNSPKITIVNAAVDTSTNSTLKIFGNMVNKNIKIIPDSYGNEK